ncbi:PREDICTED: senescence/dehydration-associated protein At4g35985, chloroplastic [Camelina sativa]|uniref:Senescence/dehydration-associated protein At4g35985, chloroplastic n=1 Tax=Camelina sativa TaxID=90675 RepID=A0ABM1QJY5_CAMSA|nr:PREDICTED: senescence/dehydration-associated protein At4g35985, chloroplastic [Camelina sativa]
MYSSNRTVSDEVLLKIDGCRAHLIDGSEAVELAAGDFELVQVFDNGVALAMVVRIGNDLQWPVIKDEPVVKLDSRDYLFTLPVKDGEPLSYGVTFFPIDENDVVFLNSVELLDDFLRENSCFSSSSSSSSSSSTGVKNRIDWKEFAPKVEDYNNVVSKAIAGGTGQIIRGMFKCSNAYTNQVHKGGEVMITKAEKKSGKSSQRQVTTNKNQINKNLHRVRRLSRATEKLSKTMLNGVGVVSGSVMGPVVKSKPGKAFFSMVPGEVLLASLDALNKLLDAAEAAERQTLSATSKAATKMVSERLGESAGDATRDVLGTVGHAAGTAWNVFNIRKAFSPSSSVTSGILKNASRK